MSASSLIDLKSLTAGALSRIFALSKEVSQQSLKSGRQIRGTAALVFLEPSTRTRMSFEFACAREGVVPVTLSGEAGSSLEKGETIHDTLTNIDAMSPDLMIVRCGDSVDLAEIAKSLHAPVINAGWGKSGHPTQALLDALTILEKRGRLEATRVLLVGDVRHSRVAASHFELSQKLGYQIAVAGPLEFLPTLPAGVISFATLEEGLQWADVVMALRVQKERHGPGTAVTDFHQRWGLSPRVLNHFKKDGLVMHPGPVNWDVELSTEVLQDPRTVILDQVTHGVFLRQALIRWVLEGGQ